MGIFGKKKKTDQTTSNMITDLKTLKIKISKLSRQYPPSDTSEPKVTETQHTFASSIAEASVKSYIELIDTYISILAKGHHYEYPTNEVIAPANELRVRKSYVLGEVEIPLDNEWIRKVESYIDELKQILNRIDEAKEKRNK